MSSKLVIGHCGDTTDVGYIESLLENDTYIGLDRFGLDMILSTGSRVNVCVELIEKGYEDQIVLSQDYNVFIDWFPPESFPELKKNGAHRWSFHHVIRDIIPRLLERGVSQNQIDTMTLKNPVKILD